MSLVQVLIARELFSVLDGELCLGDRIVLETVVQRLQIIRINPVEMLLHMFGVKNASFEQLSHLLRKSTEISWQLFYEVLIQQTQVIEPVVHHKWHIALDNPLHCSSKPNHPFPLLHSLSSLPTLLFHLFQVCFFFLLFHH